MKLAIKVTVFAAFVTATALTPMAQAQTSPAEKAAIEQAKAKAAGRDLSVKIKTKKESNNPNMKEATITTTSEVSTPEPQVVQGAPDLPIVDAEQYQPITDPDSSLVYISGGIGAAEIAYFKSLGDGYGLKLVIADQAKEFVSDATVIISNNVGEKIATLAGVGPYVLVKLPAGKYTLTISANGIEVGQPVTIRDGRLAALDIRL